MAQLRSEVGGLRQLVEVQEQVVIEQAQHLSALLDERRRQAEQLAATNSDLERQIAENERLRQQAAERAILEERNRLARDLHDSVTQSLYSLTLFAEASQRLLSGGSGERAAAYLGRIGETAQQTLKEMRLLVYELRPLALERTGLVGALQQRLEAVEGRAGVAARLRVEGAIALAPAAEEGLYHIAQEALNNALKHAHAQTVEIRLTATDAHLRLTVEDDGQGFNPHQERGGGMGLVSMHERAAGLGATLDIASVPGTGTQVRLELQHAQQG
nr:sensor histidine kinase [Oscillochloris sp. ZM17-4]